MKIPDMAARVKMAKDKYLVSIVMANHCPSKLREALDLSLDVMHRFPTEYSENRAVFQYLVSPDSLKEPTQMERCDTLLQSVCSKFQELYGSDKEPLEKAGVTLLEAVSVLAPAIDGLPPENPTYSQPSW